MSGKRRLFKKFRTNTAFVRDYLFRAQMNTARITSAFIGLVEVCMLILSFFTFPRGEGDYRFAHIPITAEEWSLYHRLCYIALMLACLLLYVCSTRYIKKKTTKHLPGKFALGVFIVVCTAFGIFLSVFDVEISDYVIVYAVMTTSSLALIPYRPIALFPAIIWSALTYYYALSAVTTINTNDLFNLVTLWGIIGFIGLANFMRVTGEARSQEQVHGLNEKIDDVLKFDAITRLPNVDYFYVLAKQRLEEAFDEGDDPSRYCFVLTGLRNLGMYNRRFGFSEGDRLLMANAEFIQDEFKGSVIGRYSDDHFVILTDDPHMEKKLKRIHDKIRDFQPRMPMEMRAGIYRCESFHVKPEYACDCANTARKSVTETYATSYGYFDTAMHTELEQRNFVLNNLRSAINANEIRPFYQPLYDLENDRVFSWEALARWIDPEYGTFSLGPYVEQLENAQIVNLLDRTIAESVCRDLSALINRSSDKDENVGGVSINVSRVDFELDDVADVIEKIADEYGIPHNLIHIEVTESAFVKDEDVLGEQIKKLHEKGFEVWMDDFGSGYSSLGLLHKFDFDVVKIDITFMDDAGSDEQAGKQNYVLAKVIDLVEALGMKSLVEGVETQEQLEQLKAMGCSYAQGFAIGRPIPAESAA